jgi:PAS domain S-box-containing protein
MTNTALSELRHPLSERLPIVTYANRFSAAPQTLWMSPQVERLTGYRVDEWVGCDGFFESVLHPDDREKVLREVRASRAHLRPFSLDYRVVARDGRVLWIHDESVPMLDENGDPELIQGYFIDITERKALEERLLRAQKIESLGHLAGGIAHDFNNYIMTIRGYAELAERTLEPAAPAYGYIGEVLRTTERARRLTSQLLAFSRPQELRPTTVRLDLVVEELRVMLTHIVGRRIEVAFELAETPKIHADVGQLEQVVVNLVTNARDAMPHGGRLSIRTEPAYVAPGPESQRLDVPHGDYTALVVSDTGCGMDEETLKTIFDPFFTRRQRGRGTGLGLSIVQGIVRNGGGAIDVTSFPGHGTTFRVLLPTVQVA